MKKSRRPEGRTHPLAVTDVATSSRPFGPSYHKLTRGDNNHFYFLGKDRSTNLFRQAHLVPEFIVDEVRDASLFVSYKLSSAVKFFGEQLPSCFVRTGRYDCWAL